MQIKVEHHIGDLFDDMVRIAKQAGPDMKAVVREAAKVGNDVAKENAKRSSGKHGKLYPRAFTWEMRPAFHGFGASVYSAEYGPDIARPQGGMSFEYGSRNQKPHLDLARSADLIGPSFAQEVGQLPDKWFWGAEA